MYANDNVKIMEEFYKVADAKPFNANKLKEFIADKYIDYDGHDGVEEKSSQQMIDFFDALSQGSSNASHVITYIKAVDEDKALVRWKFKGTHDGNFFGAFPASKNEFNISGMELWEIKNKKIVGIWHVEDLDKFFKQLSSK